MLKLRKVRDIAAAIHKQLFERTSGTLSLAGLLLKIDIKLYVFKVITVLPESINIKKGTCCKQVPFYYKSNFILS
jgi:hypothetical protein